jgi:hypothetical protein
LQELESLETSPCVRLLAHTAETVGLEDT